MTQELKKALQFLIHYCIPDHDWKLTTLNSMLSADEQVKSKMIHTRQDFTWGMWIMLLYLAAVNCPPEVPTCKNGAKHDKAPPFCVNVPAGLKLLQQSS